MNLDEVSDKHLHELERLSKELAEVMRKAKLSDQPLLEMLRQLESKAGEARRERFDGVTPKFRGY
jgi:hypothetical protein